ncbi:MAG: VanW family protein [Patescibacteria group bacterium]|nr:VanW family protein [Patescibacteria group bacterium]
MVQHLMKHHRNVLKRIHPGIRAAVYIVLVFLVIGVIASIAYPAYRIREMVVQTGEAMYPGIQIDGKPVGGKTIAELLADSSYAESDLEDVVIWIEYRSQKIGTISAEQIGLRKNIEDVVNRAYLVGRSEHIPTRLRELFLLSFGLLQPAFETKLQYNSDPFETFISQAADLYNIPAQNALFTFEDGMVKSFQADRKGREINKDAFRSDLEKTLAEISVRPASKIITLKDKPVEPKITLAKANDFGIEELIAEGVSDYSGSSEDRIYNLRLAASKFHGVLIAPGDTFSFNKTIGDISSSTGYRPSYIIKNGKTVLGDGGGVCQVSTTAFRAALQAGLPIVERHAHAYRVSYYENDAKPGFDATIYTPTVDLRFINDTPAHILIQISEEPENRLLYFKLYGKKDSRQIELSEATVWDEVPPPEPREEEDPNMFEGERKQVEYPAWGAKSKFTYKVVKDGKVSFEKEFFSSYRPWQAVFLVGKKPR